MAKVFESRMSFENVFVKESAFYSSLKRLSDSFLWRAKDLHRVCHGLAWVYRVTG